MEEGLCLNARDVMEMENVVLVTGGEAIGKYWVPRSAKNVMAPAIARFAMGVGRPESRSDLAVHMNCRIRAIRIETLVGHPLRPMSQIVRSCCIESGIV